jgi:hypothetical protein
MKMNLYRCLLRPSAQARATTAPAPTTTATLAHPCLTPPVPAFRNDSAVERVGVLRGVARGVSTSSSAAASSPSARTSPWKTSVHVSQRPGRKADKVDVCMQNPCESVSIDRNDTCPSSGAPPAYCTTRPCTSAHLPHSVKRLVQLLAQRHTVGLGRHGPQGPIVHPSQVPLEPFPRVVQRPAPHGPAVLEHRAEQHLHRRRLDRAALVGVIGVPAVHTLPGGGGSGAVTQENVDQAQPLRVPEPVGLLPVGHGHLTTSQPQAMNRQSLGEQNILLA